MYDETLYSKPVKQGIHNIIHPKIQLEQKIEDFQKNSLKNSQLEIMVMNPGQILGKYMFIHYKFFN